MSLSGLFQNQGTDLEKFLENLVGELEVPEARYADAERSYHSVGEWLAREESRLHAYSPTVYIQGSFRLGTAIRPVTEQEDYDVDLVCELGVDLSSITQAELKELLKLEVAAYAKSKHMEAPTEGRRCVTLNYADKAQFHLDVLPAVPDAGNKRMQLAMESLDSTWVETAIAITDTEHPHFRSRASRWPHSNPKGFASWFQNQMRTVFEARRYAMALEAHAHVEDIPEHRVKTPLQAAVQVLKRHRDGMFADRPDEKPISIIISTLAARAYRSQATISAALSGVLDGMEGYIEVRNGVYWVENPTDPQENFADRWAEHPERRHAFLEWLQRAKADFAALATQTTRQLLLESSEGWAGNAARRAAGAAPNGGVQGLVSRLSGAFSRAHKRKAPWPVYQSGTVRLSCRMSRNGYRPEEVTSDSGAMPKGASLRFSASADVQEPFEVHWQVVNTGEEAAQANALRGDFDKGMVGRGEIVHTESACYRGIHTIECFVVKNGYLVASSGQFVVNVG